jgi:hypothetical protein
MRLPPSVRNHWTVSYQGVLVGAFANRAELDEWLENRDQRGVVTNDQLEICPP